MKIFSFLVLLFLTLALILTAYGCTSEAQKHYNAGVALKDEGRLEEAIVEYDEAIRLNPKDAKALTNRGVVYDILGQPERALEDLNEAIRLDPQDALAYHNRGVTYTNLGKHEQAIKDYDEAIRLNSQYALAIYNRGNTYASLGQLERAIEDFDEAINLKPEWAEAYHNRGLTYFRLGKSELAIEDYDEAIRLNTQYAEAYYNRGVTYANLGQLERAIEDYDEAIRLNPQYFKVYYNRGYEYACLKQFERAIEDFNKVIHLKPDYKWAYANRALAYTSLGMDGEAQQDFDRAIELGFDPDRLKKEMEERKKLHQGELSSSLIVKEKPVIKEVELKYDVMKGKDSLSSDGGGYIIDFTPPVTPFTITKVRMAGTLSGSGSKSKQFSVAIWNKDYQTLHVETYPVTLFPVWKPAWVEVEIPDIEVTDKFYVHVYTGTKRMEGIHISADASVVNEHSDLTVRTAEGVYKIRKTWPFSSSLWVGDKSKVNWKIRVVGTVMGR